MAEQVRPNGDDTWEQLVAEQADGVLPRSFLQEGDIINTPSDEYPFPMRVIDLNFKGYRKVWDTKTGAMSLQPRWLLWQAARKHHPDGTQMFTTVDPHIAPVHGEDLTCPLTPGAPDDWGIAGMGFKPCNEGRGKRHIPNVAALQSHVEHSHKKAYVAIEQIRADRMRGEDRELQLRAITAQERVAQALLTRLDVVTPSPRRTSAAETSIMAECDYCHEQFTARTRAAVKAKKTLHMRSHT